MPCGHSDGCPFILYLHPTHPLTRTKHIRIYVVHTMHALLLLNFMFSFLTVLCSLSYCSLCFLNRNFFHVFTASLLRLNMVMTIILSISNGFYREKRLIKLGNFLLAQRFYFSRISWHSESLDSETSQF